MGVQAFDGVEAGQSGYAAGLQRIEEVQIGQHPALVSIEKRRPLGAIAFVVVAKSVEQVRIESQVALDTDNLALSFEIGEAVRQARAGEPVKRGHGHNMMTALLPGVAPYDCGVAGGTTYDDLD